MPKVNADSGRFKILALTVFPLVLHVIFTFGTAAFVLYFVRGRDFNIDTRHPLAETHLILDESGRSPYYQAQEIFVNDSRLLQSDVSTILSALIVLGRTGASMWCAGAVWKFAFILLEKTGLSIRQISFLVSWKILPPTSKQLWSSSGRAAAYAYIIAFALLLPLPAQLSSPILSGAITWSPSYTYHPSIFPLEVMSFYGTNNVDWTRYQMMPEVPQLVVRDAVWMSLAIYSKGLNTAIFTRQLNLGEGVQVDPRIQSQLSNMTLPYMAVSNFRQIDDKSQVPSDQLHAVDPGSHYLNVTSSLNPIRSTTATIISQPVLIPSTPWTPATQHSNGTSVSYDLPQHPEKVSGTFYTAAQTNLCGTAGTPPASYYTDAEGRCWVYGLVDIVAGVQWADTVFGENRTIYGPRRTYTIDDTRPDPFVPEVLHLMPEVISGMWPLVDPSLMRAELLRPINDSIFRPCESIESQEEYDDCRDNIFSGNQTERIFVAAYSATWLSLLSWIVPGRDTRSIQIAIPMLRGEVNIFRVLLWFALNALLWVSAILFWAVQGRCLKPMSGETIIAAMFLDTVDVHNASDSGLGDAIVINSEHDKVGILRLTHENGHSRLVKDVQEDAQAEKEGLESIQDSGI